MTAQAQTNFTLKSIDILGHNSTTPQVADNGQYDVPARANVTLECYAEDTFISIKHKTNRFAKVSELYAGDRFCTEARQYANSSENIY